MEHRLWSGEWLGAKDNEDAVQGTAGVGLKEDGSSEGRPEVETELMRLAEWWAEGKTQTRVMPRLWFEQLSQLEEKCMVRGIKISAFDTRR